MSQVVICYLSVIFLNAVTCKLLFAYTFFFFHCYGHFCWISSFCSWDLLSTLHHPCIHCLKSFPLMSHWIHPKVTPTGGYRLRGEQGLGIHSPWFLPAGISRVPVSSIGGGLPGSPLHTAISSGSDNCTLPRAYCRQVLRYHLRFPTPCFINNHFIKLRSGHLVWICLVSCWDLIKYLSSSMINFL